MIEATEQACHLDHAAIRPRRNGHMAHAAASDASRPRDRNPCSCIDWFQSHARSSLGATADTSPSVAYGASAWYLNPTLVPLPLGDCAILVLGTPR
jgi:hypothetical protein